MALGLTQAPTEMSSGIFPGGKGGRCIALTSLPHSCANFLEVWEPQHAGTLRVCPGLHKVCFTLTVTLYAVSAIAVHAVVSCRVLTLWNNINVCQFCDIGI